MIGDEKVTKALKYLAETDEPCAKARAYMEGLKDLEKTILGEVFLDEGGTIAERDAKARTSAEYHEWRDNCEQARTDYYTMANKRKTAELIVEVWRSENANRRRGNV